MSPSRPLTLPQFRSLIATLTHPRDRAFFFLAAATGARVNALRLARLADVLDTNYQTTGRLRLPSRNAKRNAATLIIPIAPAARAALDDWLQSHPSPLRDAWLFPALRNSAHPVTARTWQRLVARAARAAGLEGAITPHSLRKLYASRVYELTGFNVAQAAAALGHGSIQPTIRYLDLDRHARELAITSIFTPPPAPPDHEESPSTHTTPRP